jgi:hypothetical protein
MAWRQCFLKGILVQFFGGGGEDRGRFMQPGGRIRPHRPVTNLSNTTINKHMRGWGLDRPGDGVASLFCEGISVKFFGWVGEDRGRNLRPGGRNRPHCPVADLSDTAINERTRGRGLERPGDGVASSFCEGILVKFLCRGGGVR